jgi:hypothetical protein
MNLILRVTSTDPRAPLSDLLQLPLGLDLWEVNPDHTILRAAEAQAERLQHMGYTIEQLHLTDTYLSTFATAADTAGYHSAASLEQDMRQLAHSQPEIVELREIGRSVENRPIWALRIGERRGSTRKVCFLGCHHAREWVAVEVPYRLAEYLVQHASQNPVRQWLSQGEIWVAPMVNPDGHEEPDSNPYAVLSAGGSGAYVVDAGANALLRVNNKGDVKVVAVFPDELTPTANLKALVGCPDPEVPDFAFVCGFPDLLPTEPVPTSIARGPDGYPYVGELKGFPAPTDVSNIWRIDPDADWAQCGASPDCVKAFDGGFTSIIDLAFGPDGRLFVAELDEASWLTVEPGLGFTPVGGTINACNVGTGSCDGSDP